MKKATWLFLVLVVIISTACLTSTPAPILPAPTAQPETEEPEMEETAPPQAEPGNTRFVFGAEVNGQTDLFLADILSGEVTRLTDDTLEEDNVFWSPDGRWLSVRVVVEDDPWGTGRPYLRHYLLNIYDGTVIDLVDCPYTCSPAKWSPDGNRLAVVVEGEDQLDDLEIFDSDGSNRWTLLPDMPSIETFAWSPDGSSIGLSFNDGEMNGNYKVTHLAFVNLLGTFIQLTDASPQFGQQFERWTPDGSGIIYSEAAEDRSFHYFNKNVGDGSIIELSIPQQSFLTFGWTDYGSMIAFGSNILYTIPPDGSAYSTIYEFPWEIYPAAISSDGTAVLVGRYVPDPDTPANTVISEIYLTDFQSKPILMLDENVLPGLDSFTHLLKWQPVP